ncbi:hypothetical protein DL89DRAFT_269096 [Linderina pennispora]|uniref:RNI-like protein n=1 Tax=Linderina pennispora TaxID=61395 RepID=A0A1Y1W3Q0_9FUNG|nr:uncharacterized protein DL89DRAFT_269096 [Linderina pennispora]ORX67916.1 hypothetical protein DL89DRAFT_269096 [Linderina pennispora]
MRGRVSAKSSYDVGACNKDISAKSQSDIDTINACKKYEGNVLIDGDNGLSGLGSLSLDTLQKIDGDLTVQNMYGLETVSLASLSSVNAFRFLNNTKLYKIAAPSLYDVKDFQVIVNPNLKTLQYKNVTDVDNFQLIDTYVDLLGKFVAAEPKNIEILSNSQLKQLDFSSVKKTSGYINIANNARDANVTFSALTEVAGNVSFGNVGSLDISKLSAVGYDFSLYTNTFKNISVPLEQAKKSITINANNQLVSLQFPELTSIGSSLNIINNTKFRSIDSSTFPQLKTIDAGSFYVGNIDNITFPKLTKIKGVFNVTGSGDLDCSSFKKSFGSKGDVKCNVVRDAEDDEGGSSSKSKGSSGSKNSSKDSSGASRSTTVAAMLSGAAFVVAAYL